MFFFLNKVYKRRISCLIEIVKTRRQNFHKKTENFLTRKEKFTILFYIRLYKTFWILSYKWLVVQKILPTWSLVLNNCRLLPSVI